MSSDSEGNLCLSDTQKNYQLQRIIANALIGSEQGNPVLSLSPDAKQVAYVGPTAFIVTILEINTLSQTLKIDISHRSWVTPDQRTVNSDERGLFAQFASHRQLFVATTDFKLLKFDSSTGTLLTIVRLLFFLSLGGLASKDLALVDRSCSSTIHRLSRCLIGQSISNHCW